MPSINIGNTEKKILGNAENQTRVVAEWSKALLVIDNQHKTKKIHGSPPAWAIFKTVSWPFKSSLIGLAPGSEPRTLLLNPDHEWDGSYANSLVSLCPLTLGLSHNSRQQMEKPRQFNFLWHPSDHDLGHNSSFYFLPSTDQVEILLKRNLIGCRKIRFEATRDSGVILFWKNCHLVWEWNILQLL